LVTDTVAAPKESICRYQHAVDRCHNERVESGEDQWTWWELIEEAPPAADPQEVDQGGGGRDRVRTALITVVFLLTISLAVTSYLRFGPSGGVAAGDQETADAAVATTVESPSTTTTPTPTTTPTTSAPTTSAPTTSAPTSTTTSTTAPPTTADGVAPAPPADVRLVETRSRSAEIRWTSAECVGSRYQVGDFAPGGGGYPNVDRCWYDHVVLAGSPSFSPPLEPDTDYVVRIQAVRQDGTISDPVEIGFRTDPE
jgi:hypothetical protein